MRKDGRTTITLKPEQYAIVDRYAENEGFTRSLAIRKIVTEWAEFKRHQLTDASPAYHTGEPS